MDYRDAPGADDPPDDAPEAFETREAAVAAAEHGLRLDKVLAARVPEFSRTWLQALIERGHVRLAGVRADSASRKLKAGQALAVDLVPTDESLAFRPQPMAIHALWEDEHLLVLDKPAGLVVHPAPGNWSGTLLNGLLAHHAGAATLPRAGIVHRLDKDTSGLMLVGKSRQAVEALVRAIAARDVHREYLALAHGRWTGPLELDVDQAMVLGHDRGARVAYRLALDHPARVGRLGIIEIAPTADYWANWGAELAMAAYHWTFLAQPHPLPERMIGADPQA